MEYLWLSQFVKIDYNTYQLLIKIFKSTKEIYEISKDKMHFSDILKSNNLRISYIFYLRITNEHLKLKANKLIQFLIKNNINVVSFNSKYYPNNLKYIPNPPLTLFAYGDISLLLKNKVYMYSSSYMSTLGRGIYYSFCKYIQEDEIAIVEDKLSENTNIMYMPYFKKVKRDKLVVISDRLEKTRCINYEYITGISDCLFIPEAGYSTKVSVITDLILEQGKDILVVPGSIYNKETYFSNYLLRDGAICIISKLDVKKFFKTY